MIDYLDGDTAVGAEHGHPRALGHARHLQPHTVMAPRARFLPGYNFSICLGHDLCPLANLSAYMLFYIFDALALVGFRRTNRANGGSELPHDLLVDAVHDDLGLLGHFEVGVLHRLDDHRMGKPDQDLQILALQGGPVADTVDFQLALSLIH